MPDIFQFVHSKAKAVKHCLVSPEYFITEEVKKSEYVFK